MATYYVDAVNGNNSNSGSSGSPWKTLTKANSSIDAGDTVIVRNGTYVETITITKANTTWKAAPGHEPLIDGGWGPHLMSGNKMPLPGTPSGTLPAAGKDGNMITVRGNGTIIDGLHFQNSGGSAVGIDAPNGVIVRNIVSTFSNNCGIKVHTSSGWVNNALIENNVITRGGAGYFAMPNGQKTWGASMAITRARDTIIRGNVIAYSHGEGVDLQHGSERTLFENNVVHDNRMVNIYIQRSSYNVIRNNFIYVSGTPGNLSSSGWGASAFSIGDESSRVQSQYPESRYNQFYNNIVVNCGRLFAVYSTNTSASYGNSRLRDSYIGFNTFIAGPNTSYGFTIATAQPGYPHERNLVENNIIDFTNAPGGQLISSGGGTGIVWRNNVWSTQPVASMRGSGDQYGNPNLSNPSAKPPDVYPDVASFNIDNYRITALSTRAINNASNGSAAGGQTPPATPRTVDYFGKPRSNPDIGAAEWVAGGGSPPAAPTGVTAAEQGALSILVEWGEVTGASSYQVERSADGAGGWSAVATGLADEFFLNTDLTPETTYYYRVRATNVYGNSSPSDVVSATTDEAEGPPDPPPGDGEFNGTVTQSSDDAYQSNTGTVTTNGTTIGLGGPALWGGFRIANVTIPPGSIIDSAIASVVLTTSANDSPAFDIYGEAADNAATYSGSSNEISNRTTTTSKVNWSGTDIGTGRKTIGDLKAIVQEIVDRPGWSSGNAMNFIFDALSGVACTIAAYDGDPADAFQIDINYSTSIVGPPPERLILQVTHGSDDALQTAAGEVIVDGEVLKSGGAATWIAVRFRNVNMPRGTVPTAAYITAQFTTGANDSPNHDIYLARQGHTSPFTGVDGEISNLPRTTNKATWTGTDIGTGLKASPDFADALAEVFALEDWSVGNSLTVILDSLGGTGTGIWLAAFEHPTAQPITMTIEFEPGGIAGAGEVTIGDIVVVGTGTATVGDPIEADGEVTLGDFRVVARGTVGVTADIFMPDRSYVNGLHTSIVVADHYGVPIGELPGEIESVAWKLNDAGQARLVVPHPGVAADLVQIGNRLLIEFDNGLPSWTGFIDPPRRWEHGRLTLTAYSGHRLTTHRVTGRDRRFTAATAGGVLMALVQEQAAPSVVLPGAIWTGGATSGREYHYESLHEVLADLVQTAGVDYDVTGAIENGRLVFRIHLYERRGRTLPDIYLLEGRNIAVNALEEQGPIINEWLLAGAGVGWGETGRAYARARDERSAAGHGLRQDSEVLADVAEAEALAARAQTQLNMTRDLYAAVSLTALNLPPGAFGDYDVGDVVNVELYTVPSGGLAGTRRVVGATVGARCYCYEPVRPAAAER